MTYSWCVTEVGGRLTRTDSESVWMETKNLGLSVDIVWKKPGRYFLTLTGLNREGCKNTKGILISVNSSHSPIAHNDYIYTTWLASASFNPVNNDQDIGNDIDPHSLRILTKPSYGKISSDGSGNLYYLPEINSTATEEIVYKICDSFGQCDSAVIAIKIKDPGLFIPEGLSINGDGLNELFVIKGLGAYPESELKIYRRDGVMVYHNNNYKNNWDGTQTESGNSKSKLPSGTYYYVLQPGGTKRIIKGFIFITY